jgi:hypothetical protein
MKFNKIYNHIIESLETSQSTEIREAYAVIICEAMEGATGEITAIDATDDCINFNYWDILKEGCEPMTFTNALNKYCKYIEKFNFNCFNSETNLSTQEVIQRVTQDASKYKNIKGDWYFNNSVSDGVFGIEVDRLSGMKDAIADQIEGEDIFNW